MTTPVRRTATSRAWSAAIAATLLLPSSSSAEYNALTDHTQPFPNTKTMMIDYLPPGWNSIANDPAIRQFMSSHYDAIIGGHDLSPYTANKPPQFMYTNYYCTYVGQAEYLDAQAWAASHGVDLESFFIHYATPTHACFGSACFDLPAGSRVPTYTWYGSNGDLTKTGARVVFNVGNPHYRQWRLDSIGRSFASNPFYDGVMIDNVAFNAVGVKLPTTSSGGTFVEYPHAAGGSAGADYTDDLLTLMSEFKAMFGSAKAQVPNVSSAAEDPRIYPHVWGVFREIALQPPKPLWLPGIAGRIAQAGAHGVRNLMGSVVFQERHAIATLALYYLVKSDWTYFFPMRNDVSDLYSVDPRTNQWFAAAAYDIGQPVNDPSTQEKYSTFRVGIDPASANKVSLNVQTVTSSSGSYILVDPSQSWSNEQWKGKKVVFPSGRIMPVYHSGPNWISVWAPAEVPTAGKYEVGDYTFTVYSRTYEKGIVLFRPLGELSKSDDSTAAVEKLPATAGNPKGEYLVLKHDGTVNPTPVTTITLRNTEGAILLNAVGPRPPQGLRIQP